MGIGTAIARIASSIVGKAAEGAPRAGPWRLSRSGGWLMPEAPGWGNYFNWFQMGGSISGGGERSAVVARCISLYAKTTASLPGNHWRKTNRGGRERVTNSALSRTLRRPNSYQSPSDFILNLVDSLYRYGNAYALATRNERYEIDELHLMDARQSRPTLIAYEGSLFFQLGGNAVVEKMLDSRQIIVPQRDVLHIRLRSGDQWPQPLIGEPPLHAAMSDIAISDAFLDQQMNFLKNRAAPSAVLSTDLVLDKDQTQQLRDRWNEQAKGLHSGGVPILTGGLKVQPWTQPAAAKDMQLAELLKLTDERICWAFDIPPQLLALVTTPASSTEALIQLWLKTGLGFALNHVEQSFDRLFGLKGEPDDYCEFDSEALLRATPKDRIDMWARATQGGIMSPNEVRNAEGLDSVEYGFEPRLQAQVIPLSAAGSIWTAPTAPAAPSAAVVPRQLTKAQHLGDLKAIRRRVAGRR